MAGTVTASKTDPRRGQPIGRVDFTWTSDGSGNANGTTASINGTILRVATNPSTAAPTDNYDIVINDEDGIDVMAAALANRSTSASQQVIPDPGAALAGTIEPQVSNAGASKGGVISVYYR